MGLSLDQLMDGPGPGHCPLGVCVRWGGKVCVCGGSRVWEGEIGRAHV